MNYLLFVAVYLGMGLAVFAIGRSWHTYLIRLADKHDIPTRRKIAAGWYPVVAVLMLGIMCSAWIYSVILLAPEFHRDLRLNLLVLIGFLAATLPTIVWWARRWKQLAALGYGRQRGRS